MLIYRTDARCVWRTPSLERDALVFGNLKGRDALYYPHHPVADVLTKAINLILFHREFDDEQ
jgi:hypothetical protein